MVTLAAFQAPSAAWAADAATSAVTVDAQSAQSRTAMARRPYRLGPDDQIIVEALHASVIKDRPFRIDSSGYITVPLAGRVPAAGLTVEELQNDLTNRLRPFIRRPEVAVTITEFRSQPVSVAGPVNNPGVYQLQGHKTLMELLSLAGGAKPEAADTVRITRRVQCAPFPLARVRRDASGQFVVGEVSLQNLLEAKNPAENPEICPEDVITLARAPLVYVMGEVRKPGGFPLREREQTSVLEAISMAEGLLRTASASGVRILRAQPNGAERIEIAVNLKTITNGHAEDIPVKPNDILVVPNNVPRNALLRAAEAAVQMGTGVVIWRR
jgi:polysaccharide export outer membrane protein